MTLRVDDSCGRFGRESAVGRRDGKAPKGAFFMGWLGRGGLEGEIGLAHQTSMRVVCGNVDAGGRRHARQRGLVVLAEGWFYEKMEKNILGAFMESIDKTSDELSNADRFADHSLAGRSDVAWAVACAAGQDEELKALLPALSGERVVRLSDFSLALEGSKKDQASTLVDVLEVAALCANVAAVEMLVASGNFSQEKIDRALMTACVACLPLDNPKRRERNLWDAFDVADQGARALLPSASEEGTRQAAAALDAGGIVTHALRALFGASKAPAAVQVAQRLKERRAEREHLKANPEQKITYPLGDWH
jgi:hypothetical protein